MCTGRRRARGVSRETAGNRTGQRFRPTPRATGQTGPVGGVVGSFSLGTWLPLRQSASNSPMRRLLISPAQRNPRAVSCISSRIRLFGFISEGYRRGQPIALGQDLRRHGLGGVASVSGATLGDEPSRGSARRQRGTQPELFGVKIASNPLDSINSKTCPLTSPSQVRNPLANSGRGRIGTGRAAGLSPGGQVLA